jgi:hypothetical protein
MPISPLPCDEEYDPVLWLGKPDDLVQIKMPDRDYSRPGDDHFVTHDLLDGFATSRMLHYRRTWNLPYTWLYPDAASTLMEFVTRQRGIGPWVFIDPHIRNVLTPNQASGTDALLSTEGFAVTGTGEELSSSSGYAVRGTRSLLWTFTEPVTGDGGVLKITAPHDLTGWVTPPEHNWVFSGSVRSFFESMDVRPRLVWFNNVGGIISSVTGTTMNVSTSADSEFCVTGQAPSGAVYVEPQLVVSGASLSSHIVDTFTRTVANGLGTTDTNQVWSSSGGAASDYSVGSGEATHSNGSVNVARMSSLPVSYQDVEFYLDKFVMGGGITPAGAAITCQFIVRSIPFNYYAVELLFTTSNTVELRLRKLIGGSFTLIATSGTITGLTPSGQAFSLRFRVEGTSLKARTWARGTEEPTAWTVEGTDSALTGAGEVAIRTMLESGNSNTLPVTFSFDGLHVVTIPSPGLYVDELQLEMDDECHEWEYGQGQPLVSVRADGETVPRIRRTSLSYVLTEVTP